MEVLIGLLIFCGLLAVAIIVGICRFYVVTKFDLDDEFVCDDCILNTTPEKCEFWDKCKSLNKNKKWK